MNRRPKVARTIAPLPAKRGPYADVASVNPVRGHKGARIVPYSVTCRNPHRANNADRYSNRLPFVPTEATPQVGTSRALLTGRNNRGQFERHTIPTPTYPERRTR